MNAGRKHEDNRVVDGAVDGTPPLQVENRRANVKFKEVNCQSTHHLMALVVDDTFAADLAVSDEERFGLRPSLLKQRVVLAELLQVHIFRNLHANDCVSYCFCYSFWLPEPEPEPDSSAGAV